MPPKKTTKEDEKTKAEVLDKIDEELKQVESEEAKDIDTPEKDDDEEESKEDHEDEHEDDKDDDEDEKKEDDDDDKDEEKESEAPDVEEAREELPDAPSESERQEEERKEDVAPEVSEESTKNKDSDDTSFWAGTTPVKEDKGMNKPLIYLILIIVAVVGSFLIYKFVVEKPVAEPEVVAPSPTPEVTEAPKDVNVADFDVEVLNGSGISGEAGRATTVLEDGDFVVGDTGNADNYDYEATVISVKKDVPQEVIDKLIEVLSESYEVDEEVETDDDQSADIVVIVGKNKSE